MGLVAQNYIFISNSEGVTRLLRKTMSRLSRKTYAEKSLDLTLFLGKIDHDDLRVLA
jgi:hypothetical protein